jgi:hypothetical protein
VIITEAVDIDAAGQPIRFGLSAYYVDRIHLLVE